MSVDRTHDISNAAYHVKDIKALGQVLTDAGNAAFPNKGRSRYKEAHVLLLSWEDDDLGVIDEIADLQDVFEHDYKYETEVWKIPSRRSHNTLASKILQFVGDYEAKDSLLVVYYGGHGLMNDDRQCIWSWSVDSHHRLIFPEFAVKHTIGTLLKLLSTSRADSVEVRWYALQTMLEEAQSDVILLLDCCAAASSASGAGSGITEVIAACGFETWAPGVGEHSFTRSLIEELRYLRRTAPFSTALLHNTVLSRVKYWKPRYGRASSNREQRKTPIYIVLSNEAKQRSIEIAPIWVSDPAVNLSKLSLEVPVSHESNESSQTSCDTGSPRPSQSSKSSVDEVWPDTSFRCPKALITVALEEEQWLSTQQWEDWLRSIPALVKFANVEGVYGSDSTLLLLSIPIAVWSVLPMDPAIAFVGFSRTSELLKLASPSQFPAQGAARLQRMFDDPKMIAPDELYAMLENLPSKDLLLLDLRAPSQYKQSRIFGAWNIRTPMTLSKRSLYDVPGLADAIEKEIDKNFARWREAKIIVVYDTDSNLNKFNVASTLTLRRFITSGWNGKPCIVRGGFLGVLTEFPHLIKTGNDTVAGPRPSIESASQVPKGSHVPRNETITKYEENAIGIANSTADASEAGSTNLLSIIYQEFDTDHGLKIEFHRFLMDKRLGPHNLKLYIRIRKFNELISQAWSWPMYPPSLKAKLKAGLKAAAESLHSVLKQKHWYKLEIDNRLCRILSAHVYTVIEDDEDRAVYALSRSLNLFKTTENSMFQQLSYLVPTFLEEQGGVSRDSASRTSSTMHPKSGHTLGSSIDAQESWETDCSGPPSDVNFSNDGGDSALDDEVTIRRTNGGELIIKRDSRSTSSNSIAPSGTKRSEPRCWDHGCNGRQFATFIDLLKHHRQNANP